MSFLLTLLTLSSIALLFFLIVFFIFFLLILSILPGFYSISYFNEHLKTIYRKKKYNCKNSLLTFIDNFLKNMVILIQYIRVKFSNKDINKFPLNIIFFPTNFIITLSKFGFFFLFLYFLSFHPFFFYLFLNLRF